MTSQPDPEMNRSPRRNGKANGAAVPSAKTFSDEFNETLVSILDLDGWRASRNPGDEYRRIEAEVARAVESETAAQAHIRDKIFPLLAECDTAPPGAGHHKVSTADIIATQQGLLFNGSVEACDGTSQAHDSLALTIYQIGVSLVSYHGDGDSWQQRLFRRDLQQRNPDPVDAVVELLEKRGRRGGLHKSSDDPLSQLARRGLMSYAERAVLVHRAHAPWRMGHGSPAPLELIVATFPDLVIESIKVIRKLIAHERFIFVASEPDDRALLSIGQGLLPMEYILVGTLNDRIDKNLENWAPLYEPTVDTTWDGEPLTAKDWVMRFRDEVAPKVVYGLYRATRLGPPQLFYAHIDKAAVAVRIALADSVLLEQRGFPALIDLADHLCRSVYGGGSLREMTASAYTAAGAPFRYQSERSTREQRGDRE